MYADVAVASDMPSPNTFSYAVPSGIEAAPGDAVLVPFGRQHLTGIIMGVSEHAVYEGAVREIELLGERLLMPHQVELARWMAYHYFARIADCVALFLPPEAGRRLVEMVRWTGQPAPDDLPAADRRLLDRLARSGQASPAALRRSSRGSADAAVARFIQAGIAERALVLARPPEMLHPPGPPAALPPTLSGPQREAVERITESVRCGEPATFLLHGVTGSGKTEVYLAAAEAARAAGKRAIVLVPEIVLTPQTLARFEARFPERVAVSHSGLASANRYQQWHEVRDGGADVVIGARGSLFLPQRDVGLIVLDEEHEWSYKQQDPSPRYHARDVARRLAALTGATIVLGSATPDVVSYHRAVTGRYHLLTLPTRVVGTIERRVAEDVAPCYDATSEDNGEQDSPELDDIIDGARVLERSTPTGDGGGEGGAFVLPPVTIVDLAAELRAGNRTIFSRALHEALARTLRDGEQAILFLNRRGSASFVLCRDCGHVPRCSSCLVPMTYHAGVERLRCHHCNRSRKAPAQCPECKGTRIRYLGLGTQKVEEEVRTRFPSARVLRWDRDTAKTGGDHAELFGALSRREADVLVGTQMIAKGLDLPGVTLVGVVSADVALNLPDYRAGERAFQLLTQVAGRAGRGDRPGRVIVQTYAPNHYAVRAAAAHNYAAMYRAEIDVRRRAGYPPFGRLARLLFQHTNAGHAAEEAERVARELREQRTTRGIPSAHVIGPAPAFMEKLRGRWRWQIVLRAPDPGELLRAVTLPRGWSVDVDPAALL